MATIDELLIRLDATTEGLRRELARAEDATARTEGVIDRAERRINAAFDRMAKSATAWGAAAVAAGVGLGALTKRAVESVVELDRQAEMAGVSVQAFQELGYAASQYSVSQDALTDGLKELSLRADEFAVTGAGSAADAFQRLGFSQDEVNAKLADTPELLTEVVRRMEDLGQAAKIRIADELFGGTGGEQFVAMINGGADALIRLRDEANRLGLVLDQQAVEQARLANVQFERMSQILDVNLTRVMTALAPLVIRVGSAFAEAAPGIVSFVQAMLPLSMVGTQEIGRRIGELETEFERITGQTLPAVEEALRNGSITADQFWSAFSGPGSDEAEARVREIIPELQRLRDASVEAAEQQRLIEAALSGSAKAAGEMTQAQEALNAAMAGSEEPLNKFAELVADRQKHMRDQYKSTTQLAVEELERQKKAWLAAGGDIAEANVVFADKLREIYAGTANEQIRIANEGAAGVVGSYDIIVSGAQAAGAGVVEAFEEATRKSASLVDDAADKISASMSKSKTFRSYGNAKDLRIKWNGDVVDTKTGMYLGQSVDLPEELMNAVSGRRQYGGPVMAGKPYLVGEAGPEIMVPSVSGRIIPNHKISNLTSNTASMTQSVTINVSGAGDPNAVADAVVARINSAARQGRGMIEPGAIGSRNGWTAR